MLTQTYKRDLALVFFAALIFFSIGLGVRPYLTPSEARYIEIPRQMLATGDWLTPRIDGVPYFEKPPLFYWLQASAMQCFGTGEFAGRIVTAILAALTCVVTFALAALLYGRRAGWLAAMVLATSVLGYALSRVAMVDMPVSLFMTICIACFLAAQHIEDGQKKNCLYLAMYIAAGLAVMSKGLIGMVIPGLVIGAWIVMTKQWRILKEARLIAGLIVFLLIAAPWHWLMAKAHPDFLDFYFIHEHFSRFTTDEAKRVQPWWFFAAITVAGLLPWTGLLPMAVADASGQRLDIRKPFSNVRHLTSNGWFFLLWIALPFLFFSASHSKLAPYIFPIFPPMAILLGKYLAECWEHNTGHALRKNTFFIILFFGIAILLYFLMPLPQDEENKLALMSITPLMLAPVMLGLAGLAYVLFRKYSAAALIVALAAFGAVVDITANYAVAVLDHATIKPLALELQKKLREGDVVVAYGSYFQDLPVYLNRNVAVAGYTGELDFGFTHYPQTHDWMISEEEFWKRCAAAKTPVYVFMKKTTLDATTSPENCRLQRLANYGKTVLLERQPK